MSLGKESKIIIIVVAIIAIIVIAAAALSMSGMFAPTVEMSEYEFEGCSMVIPNDTNVSYYPTESSGIEILTWNFDYYNETGENAESDYIEFEVVSGSSLVSESTYIQRKVADGAVNMGKYGEWTILDISNMSYDSGEYVYAGDYFLVSSDSSHIYELNGDNLDFLKQMADSFVKK